MTVEELIRKLKDFPPDMHVKVVTAVTDDVINVVQDGEDFVKIVVSQGVVHEDKWNEVKKPPDEEYDFTRCNYVIVYKEDMKPIKIGGKKK